MSGTSRGNSGTPKATKEDGESNKSGTARSGGKKVHLPKKNDAALPQKPESVDSNNLQSEKNDENEVLWLNSGKDDLEEQGDSESSLDEDDDNEVSAAVEC